MRRIAHWLTGEPPFQKRSIEGETSTISATNTLGYATLAWIMGQDSLNL